MSRARLRRAARRDSRKLKTRRPGRRHHRPQAEGTDRPETSVTRRKAVTASPAADTGAGSKRTAGRRESKRATEVDTAIGTKVRLRRAELGMTQTQLANAIGVTFQQVQKYERGTDRIGASRLVAVAAALDVPVSYFFDESAQALEEGGLAALLHEPSAIALLEAFAEIQDLRQRRCVIDLVRALGGARQTAKKARK